MSSIAYMGMVDHINQLINYAAERIAALRSDTNPNYTSKFDAHANA